LILSALAGVSALMPGAASASSLLSGYGGPGQGNQAILGATLLNGRSNGGGTAGGGGSSATGGGELRAASGPVGEARPQRSAAGHGTTSAKHGTKVTAGRAGASREVSPASPISPGLARAVSGDSGTLGLSGQDVLYIILALGVLALTGALTVQLMRDQDGREGAIAKGMRRRTRRTE
jgi:hypothetical protein